ncbi:hypothetical protein V8C86DRAFT_2586059 [Haematococcus lacustris]
MSSKMRSSCRNRVAVHRLFICLCFLNHSIAEYQTHHLYHLPIVNASLQLEMEACGDFGPSAWSSRQPGSPQSLQVPALPRALWGTAYAQRRIWEHQHPYSCRSHKLAYYSSLDNGHGIGSTLHLMGHALGIAMALGRVFIMGPELSVWGRGKHCEGMRTLDECYFLPLSSCTYDDILDRGQATPYKSSEHTRLGAAVDASPEAVHFRHFKDMGNSHNVSQMFTNDMIRMLKSSPIPQQWWFYWWRCQASAYIVRPNRRTLVAIEHARNLTLSVADRHALSSGSWVSVYMRRGDKAKERPLMLTDPQPFLDLATRMLNSHPGKVSPRILLATEDVDVHRYFITQSVVPVYATNVTRFPANTSYSPMDHAQRIGPHVEFINALLSLELSFSGNGFVMAMTSNWGRLINEMRSTIQCKAHYPFVDPEQPHGITKLDWR